MNDLPHNELLSAYLDGELTPAEQAEVERLLANDPASRQLLDELRMLSTTLQGLPRETVGEDLSRQVLRIAERRMLSEGEPRETDSSALPEPVMRTVVRRFLSARSLAWAGLAVAIAVLITINERRHPPDVPFDNANREVARATAPAEERVRKPGPPPTMQATGERDVALDKKMKAPAPTSQPLAYFDDEAAVKDKEVAGSGRKTAAPAAALARSEEQLVVRCDIDVRAAKERAFEKLLDSNGIAWHAADAPADRSGGISRKAGKDEKQMLWGATTLSATIERGQPKRLYADATPAQVAAVLAGLAAQPSVFLAVDVSGDSSAYGGVHDWRFAEQPRGNAKADSSSPGVMNLRAKSATDAAAKNAKASAPAIVAGRPSGRESFEFEQRVRVAGPTDQRGAVGQLDVSVKEGVQQQSLAAPSASIQADELRMANQPAQIEPASQAMPRRRVLFVLHIVDAPPPAAAGEPAKASKPDK